MLAVSPFQGLFFWLELIKATLILELTRMTRISSKIIYPELSYKLNGIFFQAHRKLGRFCNEKQYSDLIEKLLRENRLLYEREFELSNFYGPKGNRVDFLIENKIIIDIKAKKFITKDDYIQMLRYLECANLELGMVVNFRSTYLKPKRVLNSKFKNSDNSNHSLCSL